MPEKPNPTRTTGPLHFEDLDPHRFEDLVRRLVYDFRPWRQLEATGRSGSDDGFDARGFEVVPDAATAPAEEDDEDDPADVVGKDRIWLVQCKREKTITPKKLVEYLDAIPAEEATNIYGVVFAAACEFSKAARDAFRSKAQELGFSEAHLWGKGELEDMLYQPKNDDVLFTFFGISKRLRQRSIAADVRRRLTIKRKALRILQDSADVLVRDASDARYPYPDKNESDVVRARRWSVYRYGGCYHDGLHLLGRRCLAFIGDDGISWDYAEKMDDAPPHHHPWRTEEGRLQIEKFDAARADAIAIWDALPEGSRAWLEKFHVLPFENIIDIDENGDDWFKGPHIYISEFSPTRHPFRDYMHVELANNNRWALVPRARTQRRGLKSSRAKTRRAKNSNYVRAFL